MFNLIFLTKENELNKILKSQRRSRKKINVLFTSLWDQNSIDLVESLKEQYPEEDVTKPPLYVVDSFTMPHSYVIYGTTKVPHLVRLNMDKVHSEDYLPVIKETLGLLPRKWSLTR
tara:strand:+ start:2041 stop:2388 length:348 start_codon:yes stop_codon:yes gene_type:complete